VLLLQRKLKLGHTKPSTEPHSGRGLDIAALEPVFLNGMVVKVRIGVQTWQRLLLKTNKNALFLSFVNSLLSFHYKRSIQNKPHSTANKHRNT